MPSLNQKMAKRTRTSRLTATLSSTGCSVQATRYVVQFQLKNYPGTLRLIQDFFQGGGGGEGPLKGQACRENEDVWDFSLRQVK